MGGKKQRLVSGSMKRIIQAGRGGNSDSARGRLTERTLALPPRDAPYPREPNASGGKPFPIRPSIRKGPDHPKPTHGHVLAGAEQPQLPRPRVPKEGKDALRIGIWNPCVLGSEMQGVARRADLDSTLASARLSWAFSSLRRKDLWIGQARTRFVWTVRVCYARLSGLPVGYAVFPRA